MTLSWYTFGGGEELTDLLMNITMLARSGGFINLIDLLMMTGLFFAFILAIFSGRIFSTPIRNFIIMMIVVYGLLKPTSDVVVADQRTGHSYNVSNVPLGVALFGYFQSSLSSDLVNFFENTLNTGNYYASYAKYGFGFGPFSTKAIVEFMNSPAIGNGNPEYGRLMTNLSRFSQECFGYSAAQSDNNMALMAIKAMPASKDAFRIFLGQDPDYPYINGGLTMDYVGSDNSLTSLSCTDAGAEIYSDVLRFINNSQVDQNFVNQVQGMLSANPSTLSSDLQTALQYHFNSLSQLDNLKMNILFSSMSYDFIKLGASGLSNNASVSNYAVNSVLGSAKMGAIQQAVENFGQGAIAVALAPKMLNFTKMMYYLLFFVLLTLALTPLAKSIGKVTLVFFVFLTILEPLYVLLNYLLNTMAYYQASASTTCNNSPAGIISCLDINSLFYTNVLNFSVLGLIGLAYMLSSAMVTGSGAVIGAIGEKFGSGAMTYQGANNNMGSLSNFLNDPVKAFAAQNTSMSSFASDGGAGFQSSLANAMASTAARRGVEAGQFATNWDQMKMATSHKTFTDANGVSFDNATVDGKSGVQDFTSASGTMGQLIASLGNSNDAKMRNLATDLRMFKDLMGRDVAATIVNTGNGYAIQFKTNQAGGSGEESIIVDKDGNIVKGNITTGKGTTIMFDKGKAIINGQDLLSYKDSVQKRLEETRMKTLGYSLAEKLGWKVDDKWAKVIGETATNSKGFEEFLSNLLTKIDKTLTAVNKTNGYTKGDKTTNSEELKDQQGFDIQTGLKLGLQALKAMKSILKKEAGELAKKGGSKEKEEAKKIQGEISAIDTAINMLTTTHSTSTKTDHYNDNYYKNEVLKSQGNETDKANQEGNLSRIARMFSHSVQDIHEQSTDLSKAFEEAKTEAYQKTYKQSDISLSSQDSAQQYASDIKLEALERFQEALLSGDKRAIISSLVEMGTDPNSRVGVTVGEFSGGENAIKQEQENLGAEVKNETNKVDPAVKDNEKVLNNPEAREQLNNAEKLKKPHVKKVSKTPPKYLTQKQKVREPDKVQKPSNSSSPGNGNGGSSGKPGGDKNVRK